MTEHTVPENGDGILLQNYLKYFLKLSTNSRKRLKYKENGILINGEPVSGGRVLLKKGDLLLLDTDDKPDGDSFSAIIPADLTVGIVYENSLFTVADKPPFMPTHPVHGHLDDTLANALSYRAMMRGESGFTFRPVNRLDRNTSGLQLSAKDFITSGRLSEQLKNGRIEKEYLAILCGTPEEPEGMIDAPIERSGPGTLMRTVRTGGSPAVTLYKTLGASPDGRYSLVLVKPRTGRTHQIRVHMAYIGCPLLGDFLYGEECGIIARHALHASMLSFDDPSVPSGGKRMIFRSGMPEDMASALRQLDIH